MSGLTSLCSTHEGQQLAYLYPSAPHTLPSQWRAPTASLMSLMPTLDARQLAVLLWALAVQQHVLFQADDEAEVQGYRAQGTGAGAKAVSGSGAVQGVLEGGQGAPGPAATPTPGPDPEPAIGDDDDDDESCAYMLDMLELLLCRALCQLRPEAVAPQLGAILGQALSLLLVSPVRAVREVVEYALGRMPPALRLHLRWAGEGRGRSVSKWCGAGKRAPGGHETNPSSGGGVEGGAGCHVGYMC